MYNLLSGREKQASRSANAMKKQSVKSPIAN